MTNAMLSEEHPCFVMFGDWFSCFKRLLDHPQKNERPPARRCLFPLMQRTGRARRGAAARLNFVLEVCMEGSCILARHAPGRRGYQQGTRAPLHAHLPSNNKACDSAVTMGLLCERWGRRSRGLPGLLRILPRRRSGIAGPCRSHFYRLV